MILTHSINNDKYTEYVYEAFDIQDKDKSTTDIPLLDTTNIDYNSGFNWNIGIIVGSSGSGKSTVLNNIGGTYYVEPEFDNDKSLISNFDWLIPEEASYLLTSMGLSSIPTWFRPYNTLSNGEQYRARLAYIISKPNYKSDVNIISIDEFTSVVDRDVAKAMSFSLQKYIRKNNLRIILASCHYDILEWLMPDWIYSLNKGGTFERCDYLRQGKPKIDLQIHRVKYDTWNIFKKHHYLTENLNRSCKLFLFTWNNKPVGIVCTINQPSSGDRRNAIAISRTVVLPDFQGLGIGSKISEFICAVFKNNSTIDNPIRIFTKTANPALGIYRSNNKDKWKPTSKNGIKRNDNKSDIKAKNRLNRISYCYEYIGESISGYENLLLPLEKYL